MHYAARWNHTLLAALACAVLPSTLVAQDDALPPVAGPRSASELRPKYIGTWKADLARSTGMPSTMDSLTVTIAMSSDTIMVQMETFRATGGSVSRLAFTGDGKPTTNLIGLIGEELPATTTAAWKGRDLIVTSSGQTPSGPASERRELIGSFDGKELTMQVASEVGATRSASTVVMVRR